MVIATVRPEVEERIQEAKGRQSEALAKDGKRTRRG
jgi:hypothetical protein